MNNCEYTVVPNISASHSDATQKRWKLFLRQLIVSSGVWASMFLHGINIGAPTVYIPQIRKEGNFTSEITEDIASWLTSVSSFSGSFFIIILFIATKYIGRRTLYIIGVIDAFVACIVLYCSTNVTQILVSSIMQGLFGALQMVIGIMVLTEYISPKYRGMLLTIKAATLYWGIWVSNAIGTFFYWKMIPLFGIVCSLYSFLTTMMWPESPYWLLSKGKFRECAASHRWLKGCDEESEKELEVMINQQKEYITRHVNVKKGIKSSIVDVFKTIKSDEFYKPTLLSAATALLNIVSGKIVFTVYAIDIIKKITHSETAAYTGMLILDGITILSMYVGCTLVKFLKRRTLLLGASAIGVGFLCILSLYLYLIKLSVIVENKYVSMLLITLFSIAISCGPLIMCASVYGELIPIRGRNISVCLILITNKIFLALLLKIAPFLFKTFGLHGAFLVFAISSLILIIILYKYLPETKDKTLQEIADSITSKKK